MEAVWNKVKSVIKKRIPGHSYQMWIEPLELQQTEDSTCVVYCPNFFSRKRVQGLYGAMLLSAIQNELDTGDAEALVKNGCRCVVEGANMPTTRGAVNVFRDSGLLFAQDPCRIRMHLPRPPSRASPVRRRGRAPDPAGLGEQCLGRAHRYSSQYRISSWDSVNPHEDRLSQLQQRPRGPRRASGST